MRDWTDYPDVLDAEQYAQLFDEQLTLQARHFNPSMARNLRALGQAMFEWRGEGAFLYDPMGNRYYDCVGAGGALGLGHCHPHVVGAVKRQLDRCAVATRIGIVPAQGDLARKLTARAPGDLPYCFFGSSGTESVDAAIKLARIATNRPGFIGMKMGYHGMSSGALSVSGIDFWRNNVPLLPHCSLIPFGDAGALEAALNDRVAAVVLEPVQWASGCTVATPAYLRRVRELCDRNQTMLIVDEIQCGLGRTGRWWALEESGVVPDLLCVGKVLSGGVVPISATLYSARVREAEESRPLFNNSTFGGNPLACTAALAALEVLERDKLVERADELGKQVEKGFDELCRDFPDQALGHRGIGLMRCLRVASPAAGLMAQELMREQHHTLAIAMIHTPDVLRISPPYISSDEDIRKMMDGFRDLFAYMQKIGTVGVQGYLNDLLARMQTAPAATP